MRILYLGNIQSVHLRRWVSAAVAAGDTAAVCSFAHSDCEVDLKVLRTFGAGRVAYFLCAPQLNHFVEQFQPDVVHAHYLSSYGALAAIANVRPLIVTAWGSDLMPVPTTTKVHGWAARRAIKGANFVTVVAEHMKSAAIAHGADPDRTDTVPFGVDMSLFKPAPTRPERDVPLIVCTRNFDDVYRVDTLIAAVARLKEDGQPFRCQLIGDGRLRRSLERMARHAGVSGEVEFLGSCTPSRVAATLASADVFVSPSVSDGNNVSLTEALACGAFPIATDIPANRQWIDNGVTGLLYSPGNADALGVALTTALASRSVRQQAARRNVELVRQKANWDVSVVHMRGLYRRVINSSAPASLVA